MAKVNLTQEHISTALMILRCVELSADQLEQLREVHALHSQRTKRSLRPGDTVTWVVDGKVKRCDRNGTWVGRVVRVMAKNVRIEGHTVNGKPLAAWQTVNWTVAPSLLTKVEA